MAMGTTYWMLLLIGTLALSASLIHAQRPLTEGAALIAFKKSLTDPTNTLNTWDASIIDPCTWGHIRCNNDKKVIDIALSKKNLSGRLVPELGLLASLVALRLDGNNLAGTIPAELGNLKNLVQLNLNNNQLSGPIPSQLGNLPKLVTADFSNNGKLCWNFWPTLKYIGSYTICQKK